MEDWRCTVCGEVIGVYEPAVLSSEQGEMRTSRAAEHDRPPRGAAYHQECHAAATAAAKKRPG